VRTFLLKATLYGTVLAVVTALVLRWMSGGFVDAFHGKFTHPASSLIVGSSRAAQGLDPVLVGEGLSMEGPFLNFAFTNVNSPYGPGYLRAIRRKVPTHTRSGLFLIEANPLLVSIDTAKEREDEKTFRERDLTLDHQLVFNLDPNYDYLLRNFREPLYRLALPAHRQAIQTLHPSGWHEIRLTDDAAATAARQQRGTQNYVPVFERYRWSPLRWQWLQRTIATLRPHGRVVLVRLPTSPALRDMELAYRPTFDAEIQALAEAEGAAYVSLFDDSARYETTDGNHLKAESARRCSRALNERLRPLLAR